MTIGEKIQSLRKSQGISQEQLAAQLQISRQAVSRWETGESIPDTERIVQLSDIFQVTTDYLLKKEQPAAPVVQQTSNQPNTTQVPSLPHKKLIVGGLFFGIGAIIAVVALILAFIWAENTTEWYTNWGKFGTALFRTYLLMPFLIGAICFVTGCYMLIQVYLQRD